MDKRKLISLITGVIGVLLGIAVIVFSVADIAVPKSVWLLFSAACFANAIFIAGRRKK